MNAPHRSEIVVVGAGMAGMAAACALKSRLNGAADVAVMDRRADFTFAPSLIWVPFGRRSIEQLSVPLKPALARRGVDFIQAEVLRVDPAARTVETSAGKTSYDYLLLAAGAEPQVSSAAGLGPERGFTQDISTPEHAALAAREWERFLADPGPVIVGALPGAGFLSAAYEFVFNLEYALRRRFLRNKVRITFATPEPHAGHLGTGGFPRARALLEWYFRHADIDWAVDSRISEVRDGEMRFQAGTLHHSYAKDGPGVSLRGAALPFKYAMVLPALSGSALARSSGLGNERGFVAVDECMRSKSHPEIFAAGACVAVSSATSTVVAVPRTGYISQAMAKTAAENIAAAVLGHAPVPRPLAEYKLRGVIDAGDQGLLMLSDHLYAPGLLRRQFLAPGWGAHWAKVLFERYFLWKARTGRLHWR